MVFGLVPRYLVQYHSIWSSTAVFGPVQRYLVHYHSIWPRTIVFGPEPETGLLGYVCVRVSQTGLGRPDRSVGRSRPACLGMYAWMHVSQTGLDQADRSVDRSETGLLGCVCVHAGVSDRSRPGRPVCRPV